MKSLFDKFQWLRLVLSIAILIVGIVTIIVGLNEPTSITRTICIIWAVFCFFFGGFSVISELVANPRSPFLNYLITGAVVIGIGIFLCFEEASLIINTIVSVALPWILVSLGSVILLKGVVLISSRAKGTITVLCIIAGVVLLTLGIVFWITRNDITRVIYAIAGALLTAWGLYSLVTAIVLMTRKK